MKKTTEQFIFEARTVHGNKYDYSQTKYVHSMGKVKIICPKHGCFLKTPNNHISSKSGCPSCAKKYRPTTEEFVEDMKQLHGNKYDYSNVLYINNKTKISIICPQHGTFEITPANHRNGMGCHLCANKNKGTYHKKDTSWFIETAKKIHNDKYDYSRVNYQTYHSKVIIVCPKHGEFNQTAGSHIHNKNGCPLCATERIEGGYGVKRFQNNPHLKNEQGHLYVIQLFDEHERFIKIGITKQIQERLTGRFPYSHQIITIVNGNLYELFKKEQKMKRKFKQLKYRPKYKFSGHTECFSLYATELLLEDLK